MYVNGTPAFKHTSPKGKQVNHHLGRELRSWGIKYLKEVRGVTQDPCGVSQAVAYPNPLASDFPACKNREGPGESKERWDN